MKQIIVLASFIALGMIIAGVVMSFEEDVEGIGTATKDAVSNIESTINPVETP